MNLSKQPMDIQAKIKANIKTINKLGSAELLAYSKDLKNLKNEIGENITDYLFKFIDLRTIAINSGIDIKRECNNQKMIKNYIKGMKWNQWGDQ